MKGQLLLVSFFSICFTQPQKREQKLFYPTFKQVKNVITQLISLRYQPAA